jgi:ribonuclease-3
MAARKKSQPKSTHAALERKLGHVFADPRLLELALTHRSHTYEARHGVPEVILPAHPHQRDQRNAPGSDNEQLEFLGDAILGLIATEALLREFPHCSEGELTRLRSALVSRKRMAELGLALALDDALLLGRSAEQNGGRQKPALLANAVEAVLAAVFLDLRATGDDPLTPLQSFLEKNLIQPDLPAMREALAQDTGRGVMRDAKTLLQERVQAISAGKLRYIDLAQSGPPHQRIFTVAAQLEDPTGTVHTLAEAEGESKKEAQQRAADLALTHHTINQEPAA